VVGESQPGARQSPGISGQGTQKLQRSPRRQGQKIIDGKGGGPRLPETEPPVQWLVTIVLERRSAASARHGLGYEDILAMMLEIGTALMPEWTRRRSLHLMKA
jgi:hypothetical protein